MPVVTEHMAGVKVPHAVGIAQIQYKRALKDGGLINEDGSSSFDEFVTRCPRQREEVTQARMSANDEWLRYNVLILGETGTGKELMANIVGTRSTMSNGVRMPAKILAQNCGAFTDTLFESLLFGHRKGAFTGADRDHVGILESAEDGTVFLDEVGDLPLSQQVKLLRAIENRRIVPVGETKERPIRCRFVFATNKNLPQLIRAGAFRADLYARIAEIMVWTFPLRDREPDVRPIAEHIIGRNKWTPLSQNEEIPKRAYVRYNVRDLRRALLWRELGLDWIEVMRRFEREDEMEATCQ